MKGKIYTSRLAVCLTKEQKKKIEKFTKAKQITINQAIRDLIDINCK